MPMSAAYLNRGKQIIPYHFPLLLPSTLSPECLTTPTMMLHPSVLARDLVALEI